MSAQDAQDVATGLESAAIARTSPATPPEVARDSLEAAEITTRDDLGRKPSGPGSPETFATRLSSSSSSSSSSSAAVTSKKNASATASSSSRAKSKAEKKTEKDQEGMPQPPTTTPPPPTTLAHFGGQGFPYGSHLRDKLNRVVGATDVSGDSDPATGDDSDPALHAGAYFSTAAATLGGALTRVLGSERDCLDTNSLERHLPVSFDEIMRSHLGSSPSPSSSRGTSLVGSGGAVHRNSSSTSLPRIRTTSISSAENMSISELNSRARASSKTSSSSTASAAADEGDGAGAGAGAGARTPRSPRSPRSNTPRTPRSPPGPRSPTRSMRSTPRPYADVSEDEEEDEQEVGKEDEDDDSCLSTRVHVVVDSFVDTDAMVNVDEDNEDFISCEPGAPGGVHALSDPEGAAAAAAVVGGGGEGGAAAVEHAGYLASAPVSSPMILVAQMVHLW